MTFKRNFCLTFILFFSLFLFFAINPMLICIFEIANVDDKPNLFQMTAIMIIVIIAFGILLSIVNMITWPFSKKNICIKQKTITYNNKSLNIDEIDRLYFELGYVGRGAQTPCCLSLYRNNVLEISITHISFIALVIILIKCRHVPKRLMPKSLPILGVILYGITIVISCVCYFIY